MVLNASFSSDNPRKPPETFSISLPSLRCFSWLLRCVCSGVARVPVLRLCLASWLFVCFPSLPGRTVRSSSPENMLVKNCISLIEGCRKRNEEEEIDVKDFLEIKLKMTDCSNHGKIMNFGREL